jgi:hypothetical protein
VPPEPVVLSGCEPFVKAPTLRRARYLDVIRVQHGEATFIAGYWCD